MRERFLRCALVLVFGGWMFSSVARADLAHKLDAVLDGPALRGAKTAALVVNHRTGEVLYARSPTRALIPASNMKILTALVALDKLGPAFRFETLIAADAVPDADGAVGKLYVKGSGDPALTSEQFWRLAADLRLNGLRRVRGDLILDDHFLDRVRWHPGWGAVSSRAYHSPVGALSANYGSFAVSVLPGSTKGSPARVLFDPPLSLFKAENRAVTASAGLSTKPVVKRLVSEEGHRELVRIEGAIPLGAPAKIYYRAVQDPLRYAGAVLRMQLRANGIEVEGKIIAGRVPDNAVALLHFEGFPLSEIVRRYLKFSNNTIAETLVKVLGALETGEPGSWSNGTQVIREHLRGLGLLTPDTVIVDGSGLSREDRVAPQTFVHALRRAEDSFTWGPELIGALPIAAEDGTLEERVNGAADRVRAKTGLLTGVTGLSGFVQSEKGEGFVFSILTNDYVQGDRAAMSALDDFVEVLAGAGAR